MDTHQERYREHLLDLLLRREWAIAKLCRGIDDVQEELAVTLEPAVRERQQELQLAGNRLSAVTPQHVALQARVEMLEGQIEALHRSWSWRATSPLRRVYEWLGLERTRTGPESS